MRPRASHARPDGGTAPRLFPGRPLRHDGACPRSATCRPEPSRSCSPTSRGARGSSRTWATRTLRCSSSITTSCGRRSRPTTAWSSAPRATRSSPSSLPRPRRLRAAVEAQLALERHPGPTTLGSACAWGSTPARGGSAQDPTWGSTVHRGARIGAAGHGGQVLVSASTAQLAERRLPPEVSLIDLGEHRLKDLLQPERIFQVEHPALARRVPAPDDAHGPPEQPADADLRARGAGSGAPRDPGPARRPGRAPADVGRAGRHRQDEAGGAGRRGARRPSRPTASTSSTSHR